MASVSSQWSLYPLSLSGLQDNVNPGSELQHVVLNIDIILLSCCDIIFLYDDTVSFISNLCIPSRPSHSSQSIYQNTGDKFRLKLQFNICFLVLWADMWSLMFSLRWLKSRRSFTNKWCFPEQYIISLYPLPCLTTGAFKVLGVCIYIFIYS